MTHFNTRHLRPNLSRRLRMKGWDYSTPGYYFITICTDNRQQLFGDELDDGVVLNPAGELVKPIVQQTANRFQTLHIDTYAIMPDHVHILFGLGVRAGEPPHRCNIIEVVHWLKLAVQKRYSQGVREGALPPYEKHLWQEGFYDSISFSDKELSEFRRYIAENPFRHQEK